MEETIFFFGIHVQSNLPKIGRCPPPPRIKLGARSARSVSAFGNLPAPPPISAVLLPNVMPEKETCEFQFQMDI